MNRPKKNKIHNPTLPEDHQDLVDERNLVDSEESVVISFEDRVRLYWMENKSFVSGAIFALAGVIIVFQGMRIFAERAESQLQASFNEASLNDSLESFVGDHSDTKLGGFAALEIADAAFESGDYAKAAGFYATAAEGLKGTVLEGRARIGSAFAKYQSGDVEMGMIELNTVAADISLPESTRAEAAYHLAVDADAAGQDEEYQRFAAQIEAMPNATPWAQRLNNYSAQMR